MYLIPNKTFTKKGLSGGKITSKKDEYRELTESELKVMEKNIPCLKSQGIIVDTIPKVIEKPENTKTDVRLALEKEATEFGIKFTDRTSGKELKAEIELKKSETVDNTELEDLRTQAKELEIEFDENTSIEDLKLLVEDKLA